MKKYGKELEKDTGKWIDSSVWHGKAHTWDKIKWLIEQVRPVSALSPSCSCSYHAFICRSGTAFPEGARS